MLSKIAGVITIFCGLLGTINPRSFKSRLCRKMSFRLKFVVYGFIVIFAMFILVSMVNAQGMPAKIAGLGGLIITIKTIMFVTSKSTEKLEVWLGSKSLNFFRSCAFIFLIMGLMLFFGLPQ